MKPRPDPTAVRKFIINGLPDHAADIVRITSEEFHISRQSSHAHVAKLVKEGIVESDGHTRKRTYRLAAKKEIINLSLAENSDEDKVWRDFVAKQLENLPPNISTICYHGFTEMFNNCIDHSESETAMVVIERDARTITLKVHDYGVGIFEKIRSRFNLDEPRHAILELSKGKLTTDPSRHSGEGVYFTSRMFDEFDIHSGKLSFMHKSGDDDWLIDDLKHAIKGTYVFDENCDGFRADNKSGIRSTY